ncbi:hypothetical protein CTI12_AA126830 [Artemisia annua]|uniref:Retrotransposon gag domain-containing protein n=1 Tax=Artemisia annua TaxID=35608 RepID=A0A2U1PP22_ARTAN|nr:hypothetical protein CTI12_AA126830 [Artemisia annua]
MALTINDYLTSVCCEPGIVRPILEQNIKFEFWELCLDELKRYRFVGEDDEEAHEHISRVREIINLFQTHDVSRDQVMFMAFPFSLKGKARTWLLEEIRNFQQNPSESLFTACERFEDLLFKCPEHKLNKHEQLQIFYNGLNVETRKMLDFKEPIPKMTAAKGLEKIEEVARHSSTWHDDQAPTSATNNKNVSTPVAVNENRPKPYVPPIPFLGRIRKEKEQQQFQQFFERIKDLSINIPFVEALEQMPKYAKFMKDLLTKRRQGVSTRVTVNCKSESEETTNESNNETEPELPNLLQEDDFIKTCETVKETTSIPTLKELPPHLEYAFLDDNPEIHVIISSSLSEKEKHQQGLFKQELGRSRNGKGTSNGIVNRNRGTTNQNNGNHYDRMTKIDFPKFHGDDIKGDEGRTGLNVYDKALVWHQQFMNRYDEMAPWDQYEQEVLKRFGTFSLSIGGLKKEISMLIRMFKVTNYLLFGKDARKH